MTEALLVSQVVLLVLVLLLGAVVFALARQIGVLHERIAPAGALALSKGPAVGEPAPRVAAESLAGDLLRVGSASPAARSTLLFFQSPGCPVCATLLPTAQALARAEGAHLLVASDGDEHDHRAHAREYGVAPQDYVVSTELGLRFQIAKLPYAVLLDADGIVRAQGIVNTREHLESLFNAQALAAGTIQEFLERGSPSESRPVSPSESGSELRA